MKDLLEVCKCIHLKDEIMMTDPDSSQHCPLEGQEAVGTN